MFTPFFSAVYNQERLILQTIYVLNKEIWANNLQRAGYVNYPEQLYKANLFQVSIFFHGQIYLLEQQN